MDSIEHAADHAEEIGWANEQYVREQYHPDVVVPQFVNAYDRVSNS